MQSLSGFTISFDVINECDEVDDYVKVMCQLYDYFISLDSDENIDYIRQLSLNVIDALTYFPTHLNVCKVSDKTSLVKTDDGSLQFNYPDILVPNLSIAEQDFKRVNELYVLLLDELRSNDFVNQIYTGDKRLEALNLKSHVTKLSDIVKELRSYNVRCLYRRRLLYHN